MYVNTLGKSFPIVVHGHFYWILDHCLPIPLDHAALQISCEGLSEIEERIAVSNAFKDRNHLSTLQHNIIPIDTPTQESTLIGEH